MKEFKLTFEDFKEAQKVYGNQLIALYILLPLVLFTVLVFQDGFSPGVLFVSVLSGVVFTGIVEVGKRQGWKNYFDSQKNLKEISSAEYSDDYLEVRQGQSISHLKWSDIVKAKSNDKVTMVFNSNISMLILPARAFSDDLERKKFLDKLKNLKLLK